MFRWFFFKAKKPYGVPKQYRSLTPPKSDPNPMEPAASASAFAWQQGRSGEAAGHGGSHFHESLRGEKSKSTITEMSFFHQRLPSLKLTANAPEKLPGPNRKGSSSNHQFCRCHVSWREGICYGRNFDHPKFGTINMIKPIWHVIKTWLFNRDPYNMFIMIPM